MYVNGGFISAVTVNGEFVTNPEYYAGIPGVEGKATVWNNKEWSLSLLGSIKFGSPLDLMKFPPVESMPFNFELYGYNPELDGGIPSYDPSLYPGGGDFGIGLKPKDKYENDLEEKIKNAKTSASKELWEKQLEIYKYGIWLQTHNPKLYKQWLEQGCPMPKKKNIFE